MLADELAAFVLVAFDCWIFSEPGGVAQSVTCLTADPGAVGLIPAWSYTFAEIDHERISIAILLPSADSRSVVSVTSESMCTKYWLTA